MKKIILWLFLLILGIQYTNAKNFDKGPTNHRKVIDISSFHFTKSFISKGSLIGLNYYRYYDIDAFKKTKLKKDYVLTKKYYILGYHLNHHFNGDIPKKFVSQSVEVTLYKTKEKENITGEEYNMIGFALNIRHFDFKYITISPILKIKPPYSVIYIQKNLQLNTPHEFTNPKFEFGVELNLNFLINKIANITYL